MDVVMPDMDGLEATRRIMEQHPTPILIVTAHFDSSKINVVFEAMNAGALDVVAKPAGFSAVEHQELIAKVKALARIRPMEEKPSKAEGGEIS
jgi:two-component system chemotaxis response regulator CheB